MTPKSRSRQSKSGGRPAFLNAGQKGTRLQKFLANAGVDSRRNCEELIRSGRVTVDGEIEKNPATHVKPEEQDVRLDGERLVQQVGYLQATNQLQPINGLATCK